MHFFVLSFISISIITSHSLIIIYPRPFSQCHSLQAQNAHPFRYVSLTQSTSTLLACYAGGPEFVSRVWYILKHFFGVLGPARRSRPSSSGPLHGCGCSPWLELAPPKKRVHPAYICAFHSQVVVHFLSLDYLHFTHSISIYTTASVLVILYPIQL